MRCLTFLILITLIFILSFFLAGKTGKYNFIFYFTTAPLLIATLFFSIYETAILFVAVSSFALAFLVLCIRQDAIVKMTLFLTVATGCGLYLSYMTKHILNRKEKTLEIIKEEYRSSYKLEKKATEEKVSLEKMLYDISNLYQAPKKMIVSSNLDELIVSLWESVKGHFTFANCTLILLSFKEKEPSIDRVYNLPGGNQGTQATSYEESLLNVMKTRNQPLIVDKDSDIMPPEGLLLKEGVDTFVATALFSHSRLNGILAAEDIPIDDVIRFTILAHQFSMVLERIRLYELIEELAIKDGLTDIYVRRYFLERLNEEIERARHFHTSLSFIMLDIDHFKRYNDKYGHLVGDAVLRAIAGILKKNLREIDLVARYGGEEFSVMLPETTKEDASFVGERLRNAVEKFEINVYDEKIHLTISAGISTFPENATDSAQIIDKADEMLYRAKEKGRNRIEVYGSNSS